MSHLIDMSNHRPNMAYVGETPWHGLGHVLQPRADIDTWRKAAGLDWHANKVPSMYMHGDKLLTSPDDFHIVRSDTGDSLGVMSGRYQPVQPGEVLEFFQEFILNDDRFALETAGSLRAGKVIWALAKFCDPMSCAGDMHIPYVLLTTSFNGSLATTAQATMIRVVCNNTLTASMYNTQAATVKVPHSRKWTHAVQADAHERLERVASEFDHYKALSEAFALARMSREATEGLFNRLLNPEGKNEADKSGRAKAQFAALFDAYTATVNEGTEVGTAWTALNAVTRFVDHDRNTRRSSALIQPAEAQMASAFYGSGAALKKTAVRMLAEAAGVTLESSAQQLIAA